MQGRPFKVTWALSTKLILGLITLLSLFALTYAFSAYFIFSKDKRTSTFQEQASNDYMIGKDFSSVLQHQIDTLKLALIEFDPARPETWKRNESTLKLLMQNQSDLALARVGVLDLNQRTFHSTIEAIQPELMTKLSLTPEDLQMKPELLNVLIESSGNGAYGMVNLSEAGGPLLMGTLIKDLKTPIGEGVYLAAIGFVGVTPLKNKPQSQITVTDREGWILYSSDARLQYSHLNIKNDAQYKTALSTRLQSGTLEFSNAKGHYLGSFYRPGLDLVVLEKTDWTHAMRPIFTLSEQFVAMGILGLCLAVIFSLLYAKSLTYPISEMFEATHEIAAGNFNVDLDIRSHDELGALGASFNSMSSQIQKFIAQQIQHTKLESELAIASTVQKNLIPPSFIESDTFRIYSYYQSADQCGGDWWSYFHFNSINCFAIADATGHGLSSALITAAMDSCYSVIEKMIQDHPEAQHSPLEILRYAHHAILEASKSEIMMTLAIAMLDSKTLELSYASAGHCPTWLFRKNEDGSYQRTALNAWGTRLGDNTTEPSFEIKTKQLQQGDFLFMYTDGLTDSLNPDGEGYSKKKAITRIQEELLNGPERVSNALIQDLTLLKQNGPMDDDIAFVLIEILGGASHASHS